MAWGQSRGGSLPRPAGEQLMEKVGAWSAATASLERHRGPGARGGGRGPTHRGANPRQTRGTGPGHRAGQRGWEGTDVRPSRCPASAMAYCVEPRGVSLRPATPRAAWVRFILPVVLLPLSEQPAPQTRAWRRGSPWMKERGKRLYGNQWHGAGSKSVSLSRAFG